MKLKVREGITPKKLLEEKFLPVKNNVFQNKKGLYRSVSSGKFVIFLITEIDLINKSVTFRVQNANETTYYGCNQEYGLDMVYKAVMSAKEKEITAFISRGLMFPDTSDEHKEAGFYSNVVEHRFWDIQGFRFYPGDKLRLHSQKTKPYLEVTGILKYMNPSKKTCALTVIGKDETYPLDIITNIEKLGGSR